MDNFNSKKLFISLLVLVAAYVLVFAHKVVGADFLDFAKWVVLFYVGANVSEKGVEILKK